MGGYSGPMSESLGMPQDMAQQMRRRGLLPALMQTQPAAGTDRIQDDPVTRSNPQAYGEPQAQAPVGQSPTQRDTLSDQMWQEYQRLGQPQAPPPQPSLKQRILRGVLTAAPIALGGAFGGAYGAEGAAQGEVQGLQRQQGMRLAQQQMAQQHEQQRNSLRERLLQEIMQNQRMQQQAQQFQQAQSGMEQRTQERITAGQQNLSAQIAAREKTETDKETLKKQEDAQRQARDDARDAQRRQEDAQRQANSDRMFGLAVRRLGDTESRQNDKSQQITPATQGILQTTEPTRQMVDSLMADLDAAAAQGRGSQRLTGNRLAYAMGGTGLGQAMGVGQSADDKLARDISGLELNRVMSAARVLKGSSRAYQALERAMVHTPNPWVDTIDLMRDKMRTIQQNLNDVEQDAIRFGTKGQTAGQAQQQLQGGSNAPPPGARIRDYTQLGTR